jgi:hypothetical protein
MTARQVVEHVWRISNVTISRLQLVIRSSTPLRVVLISAVIAGGCGVQSAMPSTLALAPSATLAPTATVASTATEPPSPTPAALYPRWFTGGSDGAGILPAGSQTTRQFLAGSTFTVPGGWVNDGDYTPAYFLFPDTPANEAEYALSKGKAQEIILTDKVPNNMFAICEATGLLRGAMASEVIDNLAANEALSMSEPIDVTIGGLGGRQVDLQLSPDWAGHCAINPDDPPTRDYTDARMRLILLDPPVGPTIGIAISSLYASDFGAFLGDAMPIVESIEFDFAR